jgi:hypothetical protein
MTEIKQCWAFHRDGTRCGMPAGHPGDHAVERTWDDDDCAMPQPVTRTASVPTAVEVLAPATIKCVGCSHSHKGGPCKCGCYEFIG